MNTDQLFAMTDVLAERAGKIGAPTLRSIGAIARNQRLRNQRLKDNDRETMTPREMLTELEDDNRQLAEGTLAVLDNQISQTTGTMRLKGTFPNQDGALWPGEFLNIRLLARTEPNVVTVPAVALQRGPDGYYAYVVKPDQKVETRPLKVGQVSNSVAIVDAGLAAGEQVVTAGQYRLQPGVRVEVNSPAAKG